VLSVLDDKPHDGLDEKSQTFMQEMSVTIMDHLEMIRLKAEHRRLSNMTTGLADFVRETGGNHQMTALSAKAAAAAVRSHFTLSKLKTNLRSESPDGAIAATQNVIPSHTRMENAATQHQSTAPLANEANQAQGLHIEQGLSEVTDFASTDTRRTSSTSVDENTDENSEYNYRDRTIRQTMSRAAAFIRTALDADGVLFADASLLGFGRNTSAQLEQANSTETTDAEHTGSDTDRSVQTDEPIADDEACLSLGFSSADDQTSETPIIPHRLLQSVLKHHGSGKIWSFSGDNEDYSDSATPAVDVYRPDSTRKTSYKFDSSPKTKRKDTSKSMLGKTLSELFPRVRSLLVLGLWDPVRAKWSSLCIVWSLSPTRLFSAQDDLNYVQVWNDIITAQLGRLDVEIASKAKSDFISSISHELRSRMFSKHTFYSNEYG